MALLLLLVGLLALRGAAEGAEGQQQPQQRQEVDIQYGDAGMSDLMRGILHATNEGDDKLATELREKLDALRQAPVEEAGATPWVTECEASAVLAAELFVISDPTEAPAGISGAMGYLDEFWKTDKGEDLPYPGDFDKFMHDDGFRILRVDYDQLPAGVRKWREEQFATNTMERKFIAVLDGVAFFPPGVMTFLLPLFATQDVIAGQDPCQDSLGDLVHYHQARKEADPNTIFRYRYNGRIQVGSSIKIQTTAEKRSREAGTAKSAKDEL